MKRTLLNRDITDVAADALIYPTNVRLALTGGVGVALVRRFGIGVQIALQDSSLSTSRQMAEVGEIFVTHIPHAPWKCVYHSVATDELYHTNPEVVRSILRSCFKRSIEFGCIRSLVCSPLGAGYGDLELDRFLAIAETVCREFEDTEISEFSVAVRDEREYLTLHGVASTVGDWSTDA